MVADISSLEVSAFCIFCQMSPVRTADKREKLSMAREEGWHHETFVPDPVYRVRDFFNSWEITPNELKSPPVRILS